MGIKPSHCIYLCLKFIYAIGQTTPNPFNDFAPPNICSFHSNPCNIDEIYRRFDGSCSNPFNEAWGFAGSRYIYLLKPQYDDGIQKSRTRSFGNLLPGARILKNKFFPDGNVPSNTHTLATMSWGQFYAHDLSLLNEAPDEAPCCTEDGRVSPLATNSCFSIHVPVDDPRMSSEGITCLNFSRIMTDLTSGCPKKFGPARPLNTVTPALDLSPVYGNSDFESGNLRTFVGGLLRTDTRNGMTYPPSVFNENSTCSVIYETGDFRSNQNAPLLLIHIIFIRNHNAIADRLSIVNPHWDDETIFQETRRIMIAIFQKITYYEWFPNILGLEVMLNFGVIFNVSNSDYVDDFDSTINLGATNENSHAASRILHTLIPDTIDLYSESRTKVSSITLSDNLFCQDLLEDPIKVRQIAVGMVTQPMGEFDVFHPESITEELFKSKDSTFGTDLRSIDIQRSRDVGLASYVDYLYLCGLLSPDTAFGDFRDFQGIIRNDLISKLRQIYSTYDAVDLSTALGLESPVYGTNLGPTTLCLLVDQTLRSRIGDEKWFEHGESGFSPDQLSSIRSVTLSNLFCDGIDIRSIQDNAFQLPNSKNHLRNCSTFSDIDLSPWQETGEELTARLTKMNAAQK
ncbi:peroxidase-like [Arctopsyche grandis]|uniref:peroxidase-like n=1 Tax=Arctopsyche grandis TaxID=121162 RepID=UPI00406D9AE8